MSRLEFPTVAGLLFGAVGALMLLGGIFLALDDPAGLALAGVGVLFMGAGHMAYRLFRTPAGKKAVNASVTSQNGYKSFQQGVRLQVDENATPAEIEVARRQRVHKMWQQRPDWVQGRIVDEAVNNAGLLRIAARVMAGIAVAAVVIAYVWGGLTVLVAVIAVVVACLVIWQAVQQWRRQQRFGVSHFLMQPCPVRLGERLAGHVETGLAHDMAPADGFDLRLRCIHRYETTTIPGERNRPTIDRHEVLWETSTRSEGRTVTRGGLVLDVPIEFEIPAELPAANLDGSAADGITWELAVSAVIPGLDFAALFRLPVLAGETLELLAHTP